MDRLLRLMEFTDDDRPLEWLCKARGGSYIQNSTSVAALINPEAILLWVLAFQSRAEGRPRTYFLVSSMLIEVVGSDQQRSRWREV